MLDALLSLREMLEKGVALLELLLEGISIACVVIGLCKTALQALRQPDRTPGFVHVRLNFGSWLVLALEFQLAADILATTLAPNQTALIELALIAVIRTFLNYFLTRELESQRQESSTALS